MIGKIQLSLGITESQGYQNKVSAVRFFYQTQKFFSFKKCLKKKKIDFLISNQLNIMGETNHSFASDLLEKVVLLLKYCM